MSKVKITGNASGTGTFTISAPNSNTDRNLTLPDGAGEILTDASSLPAANLTGTLPAIDGSALTGIAGGGKVLQVVQGNLSGNTNGTSTTSTSYIDTGLSASITPTTSGNKILVRVVHNQTTRAGVNNDLQVYYNLLVGSTSLDENRCFGENLGKLGDTASHPWSMVQEYLYTTTSTSALTFKTQVKAASGSIVYYRYSDCYITLMEIAA